MGRNTTDYSLQEPWQLVTDYVTLQRIPQTPADWICFFRSVRCVQDGGSYLGNGIFEHVTNVRVLLFIKYKS